MTSTAELTLAAQLEQAGIPFEREYRFAPPRKFRADFALRIPGIYKATGTDAGMGRDLRPDILIEVEGGAWINGRHSRGAGMEADCEKSALAAIAGYRVMRVTPAQVEDGRALAWIQRVLA